MKGSYEVIVRNNRLQYKFTVNRNITILRGDSATGKTTLIEMIAEYLKNGVESGVEVICEKSCLVLENRNWSRELENIADSIIFIDEGNGFVKSADFAEAVSHSNNYYVIATRDSLFALPYSIREIYGIHNRSGNRYQGTKRLYSEFYPLFNAEMLTYKPDKIIIEDSNSAFEFFSEICRKENIICETASGKSNIYNCVRNSDKGMILVIADGAAFGPEMERTLSLKRAKRVVFFLPESFEWLILKSGLIKDKELGRILSDPSSFIESERYFSWERFFTSLLTDRTKNTPLAYRKSNLNPVYLHEKNKNVIAAQVNKEAGTGVFKTLL